MEFQSLSNWIGIPDYDTLLGEFPEGHGDVVDDEHRFFIRPFEVLEKVGTVEGNAFLKVIPKTGVVRFDNQ